MSMFWMLEGHRSETMTALLWVPGPRRSKLEWKSVCEHLLCGPRGTIDRVYIEGNVFTYNMVSLVEM